MKTVYSKNGAASRKMRQRLLPLVRFLLLLAEGHAVGALVHGGVCLVGTHLDAIQGAVVLGVAVIGALLDGAGDALVGVTVHVFSSFAFDTSVVCAVSEKSFLRLQFGKNCDMVLRRKLLFTASIRN